MNMSVNMSESEAIDSYIAKQKEKNRWSRIVGRRYEKHIAKILNQDGWSVHRSYKYNLHDHGIDLIAVRNKTERYIQCKARKLASSVHVNTVYQLYGAVKANADPKSNYEIYIYTSSSLDPYAAAQADKLGVKYQKIDFPKWYKNNSKRT